MIKNIIFDVNKVLRILNNEPLTNYFSKKQLLKYGTKYKDVYVSDYVKKYFNNAIFHQFDLGLISNEDLVKRLSENYGEPAEVLNTFLEKRCEKIHNTIFKPMIIFVKALKKQGYKVFVLSNMGKDASIALTKMLNKKNFDDIIYSCDVHMCKPNKDMFEYALTRFNADPEETLLIDDTKANIDAFESLGGNVFLFDYKTMEQSITNILSLIKQK